METAEKTEEKCRRGHPKNGQRLPQIRGNRTAEIPGALNSIKVKVIDLHRANHRHQMPQSMARSEKYNDLMP